MQSLDKLLNDKGVDGTAAGMKRQRSLLPLEIFDNTEYEERRPEEWAPVRKEGGGRTPARAAFFEGDGSCVWKPCHVLECENPSDGKYLVQWDDTHGTTILPRIRVYFLAEDPFRFSMRVAEAYELRRRTESLLVRRDAGAGEGRWGKWGSERQWRAFGHMHVVFEPPSHPVGGGKGPPGRLGGGGGS